MWPSPQQRGLVDGNGEPRFSWWMLWPECLLIDSLWSHLSINDSPTNTQQTLSTVCTPSNREWCGGLARHPPGSFEFQYRCCVFDVRTNWGEGLNLTANQEGEKISEMYSSDERVSGVSVLQWKTECQSDDQSDELQEARDGFVVWKWSVDRPTGRGQRSTRQLKWC